MDYMAPEYVSTMTCDTASDMFSLGMLFYTVFSKGKTLLECRNEMSAYKKNMSEVRKHSMNDEELWHSYYGALAMSYIRKRNFVKILTSWKSKFIQILLMDSGLSHRL